MIARREPEAQAAELRQPGASMPLEILDFAFVLFGRLAAVESAEIAASAGLRVRLSRVETVFARFELADHRVPAPPLQVFGPCSTLSPRGRSRRDTDFRSRWPGHGPWGRAVVAGTELRNGGRGIRLDRCRVGLFGSRRS